MNDFERRLRNIDGEILLDKQCEAVRRDEKKTNREGQALINSLKREAWEKTFVQTLEFAEAETNLNLFNKYAFDGKGKIIVGRFMSEVIREEYHGFDHGYHHLPRIIEYRQDISLDCLHGWRFVSTCQNTPDFAVPWTIKCIMAKKWTPTGFESRWKDVLDINAYYRFDNLVNVNLVSIKTTAFYHRGDGLPNRLEEKDVEADGIENTRVVIQNILAEDLKRIKKTE